ncbi:MAG TPA: hypothetical protein VFS21_22655 [Roseiflexaceae bacterium]|nr:hypothetical protein [Roseiflexaceae bacterium]
MRNPMQALYDTLQGRHRPEEVAQQILALQGKRVDRRTRTLLERATRGLGFRSLMPVEFARPTSMRGPARSLAELLDLPPLDEQAAADPQRLHGLLEQARAAIGMEPGRASFRFDRANREERAAQGLEISRRRYNKIFRLIARLESEVLDLQRQHRMARLSQVAKTVFAADVPWEAFSADVDTACLTAYLTANLGRRSVFTNGQQARAFDELAERLLARCADAPEQGWFAVAHVFPREDVLARVPTALRLELLDRALHTLRDSAELLRIAWQRTEINLRTMIVRRGNDSSTWNSLAGSWNKARDVWIALMQSLGCEASFDQFLPGKVLRLMAADVAAWHRLSGGKPHPDTDVWAALPMPWNVMQGEAVCTRPQIAAVCAAYWVDPQNSGWTAPRSLRQVEQWRPTPELVHGVTVNHPELAYWLRKVGVFSGQAVDLHKPVTIPTAAPGGQ